jgi:hypothetical protein
MQVLSRSSQCRSCKIKIFLAVAPPHAVLTSRAWLLCNPIASSAALGKSTYLSTSQLLSLCRHGGYNEVVAYMVVMVGHPTPPLDSKIMSRLIGAQTSGNADGKHE